jgi:Coenzyme PQQ synthesis protein D (PqqD)
MTDLEARYQRDPSIVSRQIGGETILVPIRSNVGDLESIYTLNETAALAWSLFDGNYSLAQICERITQEYDTSPEQAQSDLLELVTQLCKIQALAPLA